MISVFQRKHEHLCSFKCFSQSLECGAVWRFLYVPPRDALVIEKISTTPCIPWFSNHLFSSFPLMMSFPTSAKSIQGIQKNNETIKHKDSTISTWFYPYKAFTPKLQRNGQRKGPSTSILPLAWSSAHRKLQEKCVSCKLCVCVSLGGGFNPKNISQNGNLPQIGVKIKNIWNHHLDLLSTYMFISILCLYLGLSPFPGCNRHYQDYMKHF